MTSLPKTATFQLDTNRQDAKPLEQGTASHRRADSTAGGPVQATGGECRWDLGGRGAPAPRTKRRRSAEGPLGWPRARVEQCGCICPQRAANRSLGSQQQVQILLFSECAQLLHGAGVELAHPLFGDAELLADLL